MEVPAFDREIDRLAVLRRQGGSGIGEQAEAGRDPKGDDHRRTPGGRRFWLPLARLGAFFGAVVVAGYVLLEGTLLVQGASTPSDSEAGVDRPTDFLGRARQRWGKRMKKLEQRFLGTRAEAAGESGGIRLADPVLGPAQDVGPVLDATISVEALPATIASPGETPLLGAWQVLPDLPTPDASIKRVSLEISLTPELIEQFYRSGAADPFADVGDAILFGPEALLDEVLRLVSGLFPRSGMDSLRDESSASITAQIFDVHLGPRQGRIFSEFASNWLEREQRYFSRFADSDLSTLGVQDGTEDVDPKGLMRDQGKILWDVAKKTYLSKYKFHGEDRLREDAFYISDWRGIDFAVVPPLLAGYVWWRGLEKRIPLGETWLRVSFEPLSKWVTGNDDLVAGVSVEWGIKGFPVAVIVSAGMYDGKGEVDFIGIGTSIGMVRKAIGLVDGDPSSHSPRGSW